MPYRQPANRAGDSCEAPVARVPRAVQHDEHAHAAPLGPPSGRLPGPAARRGSPALPGCRVHWVWPGLAGSGPGDKRIRARRRSRPQMEASDQKPRCETSAGKTDSAGITARQLNAQRARDLIFHFMPPAFSMQRSPRSLEGAATPPATVAAKHRALPLIFLCNCREGFADRFAVTAAIAGTHQAPQPGERCRWVAAASSWLPPAMCLSNRCRGR